MSDNWNVLVGQKPFKKYSKMFVNIYNKQHRMNYYSIPSNKGPIFKKKYLLF